MLNGRVGGPRTHRGTHGLDERQRLFVDASASIAAADWAGLEALFPDVLRLGVEDAFEEVLLQSYLFLGYPRALTAMALWRDASGRSAPPAVPDRPEGWADRGVRVCRDVYGSAYEKLRARVRIVHPDLERWMIAEGYGKVLSRPGLSLVDRELAIVAALTGLGAPRQLHSHLRGALQVGAEVAAVSEAVARAIGRVDDVKAAQAREVWNRVRGQDDGGAVPVVGAPAPGDS